MALGRGTWWHLSSLCVAGVVLGDIHLHFAWQAWHLWHWAGFGGALGFRCDAGRRDSFGVAGVALGDIDRHFAWQAWYLVTSTFTLRGRHGTYGTGQALVARLVLGVTLGAATLLASGVALGDIYLHFAWQAWHSGTPSLCVAGVVLGYIHTDVYITYPTQLFLLLDPFHHLLCLSFLPGHNFCMHTHTHTHTHSHLTHNSSPHNLLTLTLPHTTYSTPILHHLFSLSYFGRWHTYRRIHNLSHTTVFTSSILFTTSFVFPSFPVTTSARTHTHTHTRTHTHTTHTTHHHTTYSHLLFHTQLTPPQSFTISFLFPTFHMPSLRFFCCLLEEVDMWGYPVL